MHSVTREVRYAFRQLWKAPGVSLTVVIILAVGIGATTAMFSLVEGILLRPLPFRDPDRLVLLGDHLGGGPGTPVTAREIGIYSDAASAFSCMGGYITTSYEVSGGTVPDQVNAARFTASVFSTLGVRPILGRVFTREEEKAHQPLAVISYVLWANRYQRDRSVLGRSISLDRKPYTIIGVMPRDFDFPLENAILDQTQVWVPMSLSAGELSDARAGFWGYHMVARLKDGVTESQAEQDADRVAKQVMRSLPASQSSIHIEGRVTPLLEYDVAEVRPLLRTFFLAVSVVLLIACINVAGLLLVRAIQRQSEYAVRLALGAGSAMIVRESVLEGVLLGIAGGVAGLALAAIAIRTTLNLMPDSMPRVDSIRIDTTVGGFAILVALATGALCGLAPAFAALRTNLTESLKAGVRTGTGASSHTWLRSALVVSEIAIALVLLTISGAFLRSLQKMSAIDPGFRPDHVLVAGFQLPLQQYSTETSAESFNHAVVDRLSNEAGVVAVGITNVLPASGLAGGSGYTLEGEAAAAWKLKFAMFTVTYGEYLRVMRIPLIDGRYFTSADRGKAPLVLIVNQSMAEHCWPGQRAVGKRLHAGGPKKNLPWGTVVGVVADTKMGSRDEPSGDQWYSPAEQPAFLSGDQSGEKLTDAASGYIAVRSVTPPQQMIQTVRSTVAAIDPLLALQQVQPMAELMSSTEAPRRFNTGLISAFAVAALLLAVTGIYAVVAFSVSLRRQEIAIRMALGAQRTGIARLMLLSSVRLA
ncbi:MAG TPA: ABC transporter permease, partial [Candidatus Sulfotelmatobacter sp.]|nr:ABC transporter permease [Candidatus Sulfotelmatobacter sp.]